jgi:hypothetical protein
VLVNLYGLALACFYLPAATCPKACAEAALGRAEQGGILAQCKTATPFCHSHMSRGREYAQQVAVVSDHSSSC